MVSTGDYYDSMGRSMVAVSDPELLRRVRECKEKMDGHKVEFELYRTWECALSGQAEREKGLVDVCSGLDSGYEGESGCSGDRR